MDAATDDENIVDMSLETLQITDQSIIADTTDDEPIIFSCGAKDAGMEAFDEHLVEEELSAANVRSSHTPWNLIGMGLGGAEVASLEVFHSYNCDAMVIASPL